MAMMERIPRESGQQLNVPGFEPAKEKKPTNYKDAWDWLKKNTKIVAEYKEEGSLIHCFKLKKAFDSYEEPIKLERRLATESWNLETEASEEILEIAQNMYLTKKALAEGTPIYDPSEDEE